MPVEGVRDGKKRVNEHLRSKNRDKIFFIYLKFVGIINDNFIVNLLLNLTINEF